MFDSYSRQSFSLPDSIIYSVTKNPSNPNGYQKLIQTCKYFFAKNPILVFHCLRYYEYEWQICLKEKIDCHKKEHKKYNYFKNTVAKIWITKYLTIDPIFNIKTSNIASTIIPKMFKHEIFNLTLKDQVISITELLVFQKVHSLNLHFCNVLSNSGSMLPVEEIIVYFPELVTFGNAFYEDVTCFTKDTVRKLTKNLCFTKLKLIGLCGIPEVFNLEDFYEYFTKNKVIMVILKFSDLISEEYKNRLEKIVEEILQNDSPDYNIPYIHYPGIDSEKAKALKKQCLV